VCGGCGPVLALQTVSAIVLAGFDRSGVLSVTDPEFVSEPHYRAAGEKTRALVRQLAKEVRGLGYSWEHVSTIELSAKRRPHAHFLQRGDQVPARVLQEVASTIGAGWTDMDVARHPRVIARYILKVPLSGLDMEPSAAAEVMASHGALNGQRLVGHTGAFWRDIDGRRLGGVRHARKAALVAWRMGWKI
jgi:hypothetical protein